MNAIQIDRFGAPSVLRPVVIERPTPAPDEVLVRVTRIGLNFAETLQRAGTYQAGADFAGDIGIGNGRHRRSGRRERAGLPRRRSRSRGAVRRNERNRRLCRICDGTRSADRRDSRRRFGRRRRRGCRGWSPACCCARRRWPRDPSPSPPQPAASVRCSSSWRDSTVLGRSSATGSTEKLSTVRALGADQAVSYRDDAWVDRLAAATGGTAPTSCSIRSVAPWPARWRPALRRTVVSSPMARQAASCSRSMTA